MYKTDIQYYTVSNDVPVERFRCGTRMEWPICVRHCGLLADPAEMLARSNGWVQQHGKHLLERW